MKDTSRSFTSALISSGISLATKYGIGLPNIVQELLASCSPIMNHCINRVLSLFENKSFAKIESARLGICYSQMVGTFKKNLDNGHEISFPDLANSKDNPTKADEIFEAIFKASIDDSQTIKSLFYGHLMGNLPFQSQYDASASYLLLKTAMQLTYDELCLLAVIDKLPGKCYYQVEKKANGDDPDASELYAYLLHINSLGLLKRIPAYMLGRTLDNHVISSLGRDLCRLLELMFLSINDTQAMEKRIAKYVKDIFNPLNKSNV